MSHKFLMSQWLDYFQTCTDIPMRLSEKFTMFGELPPDLKPNFSLKMRYFLNQCSSDLYEYIIIYQTCKYI